MSRLLKESTQPVIDPGTVWLKRWIWVYFWLLIFEGALRKWALPGLSAPLLIVRDPVVLIIYFQALRCGKFAHAKLWPIGFLSLGLVLLAIVQVVFNIVDPIVAVFGLRCYLLHLPLIPLLAETFDEEDIRKVGRWLLVVAVPMTILMAAQYYAPRSSWLNSGAGGTEGGQIGSAMGHFRASGTFSFITGIASFLPLVGAFVLSALGRPGWLPRWLLWPAAIATLAAIPLSGSRTVLVTMIAMAMCVPFSGLLSVRQFMQVGRLALALVVVVLVAWQFQFVQDATDTFKTRWSNASENEGDATSMLDSRVLGVVQDGFTSAESGDFLGRGIGLGSNVASTLTTGLRGEKAVFLLAEMEWPRIVQEFGPVCGLLFMGIRVLFCAYLCAISLRALKAENSLPWLLVPGVAAAIVFGQMEQTTTLGFMVFGSGLIMAAARTTEAEQFEFRPLRHFA